MGVTIFDVAEEAGVSKSTVSLVINNSKKVKLTTRFKVEQAINKLGYSPNMAARELTTNRTHTLGLIFLTSNHLQKPYAFSSVSETLLYDTGIGIHKALKGTSYSLLTERFSISNSDSAVPYLIKSRRLDGVFLIGGLFTEQFIDQLKAYELPMVIIGRQHQSIDSVTVDLAEVGRMGASHLLEKDFRRIAFINGPQSSENSQLKLRGIQEALSSSGASADSIKTVFAKGYSGLDGYNAIRNLMESGFCPDAVFGASDGITAGIMRYLYEKDIRIPKNISVLGYEDSLLSEYAAPALSVIDANKELMGEEACKILINRIKKPKAKAMRLTINPALIIRNSIK